MRKLALKVVLLITLLVPTLALAAGPAEAHWGDWHQSSCRADVWYNQTTADRVDYWTAASGYTRVEDNPWSPNGWGMYDVYTKLGWECGALGAATSYEGDTWNCYARTGCGWHRTQSFEHHFLYYATFGSNAYYTFVS